MKKILKKIAKSILIFVGTIIGLLLLYIVFNLNLFHKTRVLSSTKLKTYLQEIDKESSDPFIFVADKFDKYPVVFLGEMHKRKQDLDFFKKLIPNLYQTKGIKTIGWEFGAADYQKDADSIVTAFVFDRAKAIDIMRTSNYYWFYEDYLDVFQTIWQLNKTIQQDSNKIRFLQLNKPYIPNKWDSKTDSIRLKERKTSFDNILPDIVEKEIILKNKKILIYCGWEHSLTKFQTPKFFFLKETEGRAGERLFNKYPSNVCQLWLVAPFPPRWWLYKELTNNKTINWVFPFDAVFNQLYDTLKRPFAVDVNNPAFANLKDYNSFYAFDKFNGIKLKDFCDGAIMLTAFDRIEPVKVVTDWVTTPKELEEVKKILPEEDAKQIKTIQDLISYINPAAFQKEIKKFHSQTKFW